MTGLETAFLAWAEAGFSVIPVTSDGSKRPDLPSWKRYQTERADAPRIENWCRTHDGMGLVMGAVSGNAEMLELEHDAVELGMVESLSALVEACAPGLWAKASTYTELSAGGGLHLIYRVEGPVAGNTKLASRPVESEVKVQTLIETRGEGGYVVAAPSAGATHNSGRPWMALPGSLIGVVATLTVEERDILHACATALDQMPIAAPQEHREALGSLGGGEVAPGQDYEARTSWEDILLPLGWHLLSQQGDKGIWQRPGKKGHRDGPSATTNYDGNNNFYVFTSSSEFAIGSHTKFDIYTQLHHGGDYSAAAKKLRADGYGTPLPVDRVLTLVSTPPELARPAQAASGAAMGSSMPTAGSAALDPDAPTPLPVRLTASLTDDGNAQMLVERQRIRLRFCPERKKWLEWQGDRWVWESSRTAPVTAMRELARSMQPKDNAETKHKIKSLSWASIEHAVKLAENDASIQIAVEELDALPLMLNTPGGVVDLVTGLISPPTSDGLHTLMTTVAPDFDAKCPRWLRFLAETFQNAREAQRMIEFIQRLAGYSTTGQVTWHVLPFLHGGGANGKSVLMEVFQAILGSYAGTAPADLLLATGKEDLAAQAGLAGKRFVVCSEVGPTARFHEERAKRLTGGDRVTARFLYENYFEFKPTHHLWMAGNHQPQVPTGGGDSFWRRLDLIPFNHTVEEEDRVEGLADLLVSTEGPAILAWLIEGARLQLSGLNEPAEVKLATEEYAQEEDALGRFMAESVLIGGGEFVRVNTKDMRSAYERWCDREGIRQVLAASPFGREMKTRGIETVKSNGSRFYVNVSLLNSENPADLVDNSPRQTSWMD